MPSPPSRDWRAPDGTEYGIWWSQHDKYGLGVLLTFVNSPSRQYRVMYRGPALSAMSEDVIRLCYRVAQGTGFVWIDRQTGVAWHVGTRVMLEELSGQQEKKEGQEQTPVAFEGQAAPPIGAEHERYGSGQGTHGERHRFEKIAVSIADLDPPFAGPLRRNGLAGPRAPR